MSARLWGQWNPEPTVTGPMPIEVDGLMFDVPTGTVKYVRTRLGTIAHVRVGGATGRVLVFSRAGMLVEDDAAAHSRANPNNWGEIVANY